MCQHRPPCPSPDAPDREAAVVLTRRSVQGWALLCNGVLLFDETGELLPEGQVVTPHRPIPTESMPS
ncbi:DUF5999 family protein [Streptomyces sp. NPDC057445]|uniref:DUF5999 family protein n=1 Tax=Streptomyces sp. NPDC057445 TaxID=3346136 RepID=UPI0036877ABE